MLVFYVLSGIATIRNSALARRGDAPQWMVKLNSRGVPARAILIATSIGFPSVIADVISPDKVFLFLLYSSGSVALFVYLAICVSQLVMRRRLEREAPERRWRSSTTCVPSSGGGWGASPSCWAPTG